MKPISPAKGPAICPAAVACYALSVLQKSLYAGQVQQTSAQGKASLPLEFRHPHEEHVELTKWNLSFSIKSRRITLAANPCNKAADAPNTDLIYHFKQPEYSHHNEKSGLKTGKIPYGTNRKKARADRRVFGTAGRRGTTAHFYSLEERVQESTVVSSRNARRQADRLIRSRAKQRHEGDMGSPGTEENGATERARDCRCFWTLEQVE